MPSLSDFFLALLVGYLFGSIPVAAVVSRYRGVNIFSTGTRLAGAANVYRQVGRPEGVLVFLGDFAKGLLAIVVAQRLGLEELALLFPAFSALGGHWNPIFTRFRGGDGVSIALGMTVALIPAYGLIAIFCGFIVSYFAKATGRQPTIWGGAACYGLLLARALAFQDQLPITLGVVGMAVVVLAHGVFSHWRRPAV